MSEWRLFPEGQPPEWTTPEWYAERETAPHLEQEGHRQRLELTAAMANALVAHNGVTYAHDFGAGDGGLLSIVNLDNGHKSGSDLQQTNIDAALANRGITLNLKDEVNDGFPAKVWWRILRDNDGKSVALCTEMLEHLVDPHEFVRRIHSYGFDYLVASSPYTETDQAHYDFHTWAWDLDGYRALLENNGWRVTVQNTAWISQVLVAERT